MDTTYPFLGIHEWDDMLPDEFDHDFTGGKGGEDERGLGLIFNPDLDNTAEEQARLDEIYSTMDRSSFPDSFDSRTLGKIWNPLKIK